MEWNVEYVYNIQVHQQILLTLLVDKNTRNSILLEKGIQVSF